MSPLQYSYVIIALISLLLILYVSGVIPNTTCVKAPVAEPTNCFSQPDNHVAYTEALYFDGTSYGTDAQAGTYLRGNATSYIGTWSSTQDYTIEWFQYNESTENGRPFTLGFSAPNGAPTNGETAGRSDFSLSWEYGSGDSLRNQLILVLGNGTAWTDSSYDETGALIESDLSSATGWNQMNKWVHVVVQRANNVLMVFVDGKLFVAVPDNHDFAASVADPENPHESIYLTIGMYPPTAGSGGTTNPNSDGQFKGYISNFCINAFAVYPQSGFEIPSLPLPVPDTFLLQANLSALDKTGNIAMDNQNVVLATSSAPQFVSAARNARNQPQARVQESPESRRALANEKKIKYSKK